MVDAIVSVVLEQLTSPVFEEMQEELRLVMGVGKEIEKLTGNFQAIQAVLLDTEQRQVKEKVVGVWLDKIKGASYDMDDTLDEWKTAILKLQIEGAKDAAVPKKVPKCLVTTVLFLAPFSNFCIGLNNSNNGAFVPVSPVAPALIPAFSAAPALVLASLAATPLIPWMADVED